MSAVEDARARYARWATLSAHWSQTLTPDRWLWADALSLDLDIAMAAALPYRGPSAGLLGGTP